MKDGGCACVCVCVCVCVFVYVCVCLCMCVCVWEGRGGGECMTNVPFVLWQYVDFTGPRRNAFLGKAVLCLAQEKLVHLPRGNSLHCLHCHSVLTKLCW